MLGLMHGHPSKIVEEIRYSNQELLTVTQAGSPKESDVDSDNQESRLNGEIVNQAGMTGMNHMEVKDDEFGGKSRKIISAPKITAYGKRGESIPIELKKIKKVVEKINNN